MTGLRPEPGGAGRRPGQEEYQVEDQVDRGVVGRGVVGRAVRADRVVDSGHGDRVVGVTGR